MLDLTIMTEMIYKKMWLRLYEPNICSGQLEEMVKYAGKTKKQYQLRIKTVVFHNTAV